MTPKEIYRTGDIANLMGLSRDTVRYYEKRGLLSAQKHHSGYRYYTKQDISRMVAIMYQRKRNIPFNDMKLLMSDTGTIAHLVEIMNDRLAEEELAIREHQQTIARLKLTQQNCLEIESSLGKMIEKPFPASYVLVPHTTIEEGTNLWLEYAREHPGLDMLYEFDEYEFYYHDGSVRLEYKNTQLILYQWLAEYVDYPVPHDELPLSHSRNCLTMLCSSTARTPSVRTVKAMVNHAQANNIELTGQVFSTYALYGLYGGQNRFYLDLYMPVVGEYG